MEWRFWFVVQAKSAELKSNVKNMIRKAEAKGEKEKEKEEEEEEEKKESKDRTVKSVKSNFFPIFDHDIQIQIIIGINRIR